MQAVDFETKVENEVIHIPFQYKNSMADNVHVIVILEMNVEKSKKKKSTQ